MVGISHHVPLPSLPTRVRVSQHRLTAVSKGHVKVDLRVQGTGCSNTNGACHPTPDVRTPMVLVVPLWVFKHPRYLSSRIGRSNTHDARRAAPFFFICMMRGRPAER